MGLTESQLDAIQDIETKKKIVPSDFSLELEKYVREHRLEYIDALLHFCQFYDMENTTISKYLTPDIKKKIAKENGIMDSVYHINSTLPTL